MNRYDSNPIAHSGLKQLGRSVLYNINRVILYRVDRIGS